MLHFMLWTAAVLTFLALAQGTATDTEDPSAALDLSKRANGDYALLKKLVAEQAKDTAWAVAFWPEKDCKGMELGKGDSDTKNYQPCQKVDDMEGVDKSKIQSGSVYLKKVKGSKISSWAAKLVEKGDALSPCGILTVGKLSGGWIGLDLPEDGWTCQNGHFTAYTVDSPGK